MYHPLAPASGSIRIPLIGDQSLLPLLELDLCTTYKVAPVEVSPTEEVGVASWSALRESTRIPTAARIASAVARTEFSDKRVI
jgi:hypothetical protein